MDRIGFDRRPRGHVLAATTALVAGLALLPSSAQTPHARRPAPNWHGDIARFHEHDWALWRGGRWAHERHDGRIGWWWVVGGAWYFYPRPVYPYPSPWNPPPVEIAPPQAPELLPPPTSYWHFCEGSKTYYPYVANCPGGWTRVPAIPPQPSASQAG
jgi:hypothetical protein